MSAAEETDAVQLKRLRLRSWRRGTKEMDLILGRFADRRLADLGAADRQLYDALLSENDQDLYAWVAGREAPPERFAALVSLIAREDVAD